MVGLSRTTYDNGRWVNIGLMSIDVSPMMYVRLHCLVCPVKTSPVEFVADVEYGLEPRPESPRRFGSSKKLPTLCPVHGAEQPKRPWCVKACVGIPFIVYAEAVGGCAKR